MTPVSRRSLTVALPLWTNLIGQNRGGRGGEISTPGREPVKTKG